MRCFVHIYHTFRSKFAVDADDHERAIAKATAMLAAAPHIQCGVMGLVTPGMPIEYHAAVGNGFLEAADAEEILGYMVDEVGDEQYERTRSYSSDGQPHSSDAPPCAYGLSTEELNTVLAALRRHQDALTGQECDERLLQSVATNGDTHQPLSAEQIDALCERLNSR